MSEPLRPPGGKAAVEDLRQESQSAGVSAACIIQTSTFYRFDNNYLCEAARSNQNWVAGVCTLDPDSPDSPSILTHDTTVYRLRGLRSIPGSSGLDCDSIRALWKAAADLGIVVNVLISWTNSKGAWYWGKDHLAGFHRMVKDFPSLPVVLDHCLNIQAGRPETDAALAALLQIAKHRNVHAKISWVAAGSKEPYPCRDTHSLCYKIIDAFGPERCVWGSAYPSALWTPKLGYRDHLKIFTHELELTNQARAAILGETARRLWFKDLTLPA
jgi:predicted TIM-barrel fold metal-dependent hydrolase